MATLTPIELRALGISFDLEGMMMNLEDMHIDGAKVEQEQLSRSFDIDAAWPEVCPNDLLGLLSLDHNNLMMIASLLEMARGMYFPKDVDLKRGRVLHWIVGQWFRNGDYTVHHLVAEVEVMKREIRERPRPKNNSDGEPNAAEES